MLETIENEILMGLIAIMWVYFLLKYFGNRKQKPEITKDILNDEKYKVKGQWER